MGAAPRIDTVAAELSRARNLLAAAMQQAEATAVSAASNGMPDAEIARRIGVNRLTVRRWLGKA